MTTITLEQINQNILKLKRELDEIKGFFIEENMDLNEETKQKIEESRKRSITSMKSQEEIEKKFL